MTELSPLAKKLTIGLFNGAMSACEQGCSNPCSDCRLMAAAVLRCIKDEMFSFDCLPPCEDTQPVAWLAWKTLTDMRDKLSGLINEFEDPTVDHL